MKEVLAGIRVIEVASWTFVPSAGAVLAEWGADVIKIEDPARPDPQRGLVSSLRMPLDGVNFMVEIANRGKRSVAIDLASEGGHALLMRLVDSADVFITNYLPDVRARLAIDVAEIQARNPRTIYARGSAHGPQGEEAGRGGFDVATYWARGGLAATLTPPGMAWPLSPRAGFGDLMGGMALAGGIAAALVRRERTGVASVVDVSLLGLALWQLSPDITGAKLYEGVELPSFDRDSLPNPLTGTYETSDGRFITLMMIESQRHWPDLCACLGQSELAQDPRFGDPASRFENRVACIRLLREVFAARPFDDWCERLAGFAGVWAPVRTASEVHDDPQVVANGYLEPIATNAGPLLAVPANPVQFDGTSPHVGGAPEHAQNTEEVLLELGLSFEEILVFKDNGVI